MPRSPVLTYLLRAYRTLRSAAAAGVPPLEYAELQAERQRRQMSRRELLRLGAAAGASAILASTGGCDSGGSGIPGSRVAIVGAGIAGLHCAYRLRQGGVRAIVFDAATRIGGRMFTDRATFPDGMHCELGGELIDTGHMTMHDLAAELGIELLDYAADTAGLSDLVAYMGGTKLTAQAILTGFQPIATQIDSALAMLHDPNAGVTYSNPNGGEALDQLSIRAWLDQIGASGPVRTLLEVAYTGEYGLDTDRQSVLNLLLLISSDTTMFHIFGDSDERFHAKNGNDIYPARLAAALDPSQVQLGARLVALRRNAGGYTLTFARGATLSDVWADHVVLALPFSMLREVDLAGVALPAVKLRAIRELGYGTNAKLMAGFSSRLWRTQGSNGGTFSDLAYQSTWETSRLQLGASGILTNFTGGAQGIAAGEGTPEQQLATFLNQIDQVFPGTKAASNGKVARMHWPAYPFTKGSYSVWLVGQYTAFAGAEIERSGNLHFCGEHTSLDAQGYMEGGALTGAMAAMEVASDFGMQLIGATQPAQRILARAALARRHGRWITALRRRETPAGSTRWARGGLGR